MVHAVLLCYLGAGGADQDPSREPGRLLTQEGHMEEKEVLHTHTLPVRIGHNRALYDFEHHKLPRKLELHL